MLRLAEKRYTGGKIAAYLNKRGYKTPQGKEYYAKLVGATLSKLRRREQRRQKCTYKGSEITYWLIQRSPASRDTYSGQMQAARDTQMYKYV